MPSPWIAFFFCYGLYQSRWSAAPQSSYSPPSCPGVFSRHVALTYEKYILCTFKFSTCTCSLGEKTNKQLSLISRTKSATNLSNHIHCGEKWSQINLKCNSYFSRGTRYPLLAPSFLLLVTCCYLSIYDFFFLSDAAHLLLTGLPHRFSQLFFQQQPRIKSWWVLVFSHLRMFLPAGCVPCL